MFTSAFHPMNFITNLKFMGLGMLGIFIVIGAIILTVIGMNYLTQKKKQTK